LKSKKVALYIDGAARGNPGPAGIGAVIKDEKGRTVREFSKYLGESTNNIAEYSALVYGLQEALMLKADEIAIHADSELVAEQLKGTYRVRSADLKPLFEQALHMLGSFKHFEVKQIRREDNREADALANRAINLAGLKA